MVLDTNVLVSALRSNKGASHRLLRLVDSGKFEVNLSVPLVFEYEAAAKKSAPLPPHDVDAVIDYICSVAQHRKIHYLWRPLLKDPKDDMVLELAVTANCDSIVTHNIIDFSEAKGFGIHILTPREFLRKIGGLP